MTEFAILVSVFLGVFCLVTWRRYAAALTVRWPDDVLTIVAPGIVFGLVIAGARSVVGKEVVWFDSHVVLRTVFSFVEIKYERCAILLESDKGGLIRLTRGRWTRIIAVTPRALAALRAESRWFRPTAG
jgi:hypothetical protein